MGTIPPDDGIALKAGHRDDDPHMRKNPYSKVAAQIYILQGRDSSSEDVNASIAQHAEEVDAWKHKVSWQGQL